MSQKRYTPEQIIGKLRQAEVRSAKGATVAEIVRELGITEQTYYRWRKEYGGLKVAQAKRLKELEKENARLKRAVADLTLGQARTTQRRKARQRPDEEALRGDVVKLASRYGRYGYRRVTALLRAEGWMVNHKRVERIWRQEGLKVPKKQPKRGRLWLNDGSCVRLRPTRRGHVWSYDFTMARTHDGRPLRMLTVLDEYTRECLAIVVDRRLKSDDVLHTLSELFAKHGAPEHLRSDNGPEFTAKVVRTWLKRVGVQTLFIEPGSPWENGYNESFNGTLKDELVDREIFYSLREAQVLVEQWRREYNTIRPHSSLGYRPPAPQAIRPAKMWLRRPALRGPGLAAGLT